jgi:hypothetical protein
MVSPVIYADNLFLVHASSKGKRHGENLFPMIAIFTTSSLSNIQTSTFGKRGSVSHTVDPLKLFIETFSGAIINFDDVNVANYGFLGLKFPSNAKLRDDVNYCRMLTA